MPLFLSYITGVKKRMIEVKGLKKTFGKLEVLSDINLSIEKGMIYGLVGRSGAGKSTLLRCINCLETYDEGSLLVDGVEVRSLDEKEGRRFRKDIGMIFQQFSLLSRLTVYENIALPMRCWKYDNATIDKKVKELLQLVGIPDKIQARPAQLSGGQKQRVAIARALTMDPKVLLCDEATSALDPKTADSIIALLNDINRELGITMVIVTHQMSVLRRACEEISILENGRIAVSGRAEDIFLNEPQALKNLIGEEDFQLPSSGINLRIMLSKDKVEQPIITRMARELETDFIVLGGEMENYRETTLGSILINIEKKDLERITGFLASKGVIYKFVDAKEALAEGGIN